MSMTVPEAHAEIGRLYDAAAAIENRYPNGLTQDDNAADYAEAKRLLGEIDGLESKLAGLEDAAQQKARILDGAKRYTEAATRHRQPRPDGDDDGFAPSARSIAAKSFARQFVDSAEYKQIAESGVLNNPANRVDFGVKLDGKLLDYLIGKALIYGGSGVGGALVRPDRIAGVEMQFRPTTILDLIPTGATTSNVVEYYEQVSSINNAAVVAEATASTGTSGTKPEAAMTWLLRSLPVATIAEHQPVTNQQLADAPALQALIESQLFTHLALALETQVISGNGVAPNMLGILSNPNIQTTGLGAGTGTAADAVYHAMTQVMVTGLSQPTASVWNPIDFEAVRLARESLASATQGGYLLGPPNASGPQTLWGRPVVLAIGMPQDTALVADFTQMMLLDREQPAIRVGTINDDFTRNIQRILAELRAVFALFRPTAVCRVTGV
jgi:HK97 family phage major capsid protein